VSPTNSRESKCHELPLSTWALARGYHKAVCGMVDGKSFWVHVPYLCAHYNGSQHFFPSAIMHPYICRATCDTTTASLPAPIQACLSTASPHTHSCLDACRPSRFVGSLLFVRLQICSEHPFKFLMTLLLHWIPFSTVLR
jgi:hypothetical protein